MATTLEVLQDPGSRADLFYYLKITGLPYVFFSVVDPTSTSRFGTSAWTLSDGRLNAVQGLDLPSDTLEQGLDDIIGGIASPERIRLTLKDFRSWDAFGEHLYLSRIMAPGRLAVDTLIPELETPIHATDTTGDTFTARNCGTSGIFIFGDDPTVLHIGAEALSVSAGSDIADDGRETFTIAERNLFPCASGFPATPYHRVALTADSTGLPLNPLISTVPYTLLGRTAALYIGHIQADGSPVPEADTLCRIIGRISSVDYGSIGGQYEIEIDSIIGDLQDAAIAPALAQAEIVPKYYFPALGARDDVYSDMWRSLFMGFIRRDAKTGQVVFQQQKKLTIGSASDRTSFDTPEAMIAEINSKMPIFRDGYGYQRHPKCSIATINGERKFVFVFSPVLDNFTTDSYSFYIASLELGAGLPYALGFSTGAAKADQTSTVAAFSSPTDFQVTADIPVASCFIPTVNTVTGVDLEISGGLPITGTFFGDQGDGTGTGWVRLGNGHIVKVIIPGDSSIITGDRLSSETTTHTHADGTTAVFSSSGNFYYVASGQVPTIQQVVVQPATPTDAGFNAGRLLGRVLCSTAAEANDSEYNVFPEAVGMGWNSIVDKDSIRKLTDIAAARFVVIDSQSKFIELFKPLARENGWMLVWDPALSRVSVRRIRVPVESIADSISLTESNRSNTEDRTSQKVDQTSMRSGWDIQWGYSRVDDKFLGPELTVVDNWVLSAYQGSGKVEKIQDKTLVLGQENSAGLVMEAIMQRGYFYRHPWLRCRRTLNRIGLTLAPGSVHQIVDNMIINPFTGLAGITEADRVFALMLSVSGDPSTGMCMVEFLINRQDPATRYRGYAPVGYINFSASGHGYNSSTGVLTMQTRYTSDDDNADGADFDVGNSVFIVSRDNATSLTYGVATTVAGVATNGSTVTVGTGLSALSTVSESVLILATYDSVSSDRQDGVGWMGGESGLIDGTDPDNKWQ